MDAVKKDVEALVQKKLDAANKKFPLFHSLYEGYSVLLEETEKLDDDNAAIKYDMLCLWNAVKGNDTETALKIVSHTYERAVNAAIEAIQVAAMCEKFKMSSEAYTKPKSEEKTLTAAERFEMVQNADRVHCKDCDYFNTDANSGKPACCHGRMSTNGLDDWCCYGKKRGDNNA